jgi:hypothetical protein
MQSHILFFALTFLVLHSSAQAYELETAKSVKTSKKSRSIPKKKPEKPKYPKFKDKIKKARKMPGLFNLYREDNTLFMEVPKAALNKEFFYFASLSRGMLGYMMPHWTMDQKVLYFRRIGRKLALFEKDFYHIARKKTPDQKAVDKAYLDSLVHSFPIVAARNKGAFLINLNPFFFGAASQTVPPWIMKIFGIQGIDTKNSFWSRVKGFPNNLELEVQTTLRLKPGGRQSASSNQVRLYFSLVKKTKTSYRRRIADNRIGYFTVDHMDFSNALKGDGIERLITRWNLTKSDPKSRESVVSKPVVFHLDTTIPYRYRKYVRAGVLEWNRAFEQIGLVGAVEVRLPQKGQGWDPSDVRYSTISWAANTAGLAIGPHRANPQTGEILDADIIVSGGWIRHMARQGDLFGSLPKAQSDDFSLSIEPQVDPKIKQGLLQHGLYFCEAPFAAGVVRSFAILSKRMAKNLDKKAFKIWKEEFIGTYIKTLVMHEVGHTLGLRHNFKGSAMVSVKNLRDPEWNKIHQPNGSVMDYEDLNIAVDPKNQGKYMNDSLGAYDYLAIEYGYRPLKGKFMAQGLAKIAGSLREKGIDFGTDEDVAQGLDPLVSSYDLGDDLVEVAKDRILVVQRLLNSVEKEWVSTGDEFHDFREVLNTLLGQYFQKAASVSKYIGGVYTNRDHVNDPKGRLPYIPVSRKQQMKTLKFLKESVFSESVLKIPASLISKARLSPWKRGRNTPLSINSYFINLRARVIRSCISPKRLGLIADYHSLAQKKPFTQAELFEGFHEMIFSKFPALAKGKKTKLTSLEMETQKIYVRHLGGFLLKQKSFPGKSRLYARHSLRMVKRDIQAALKKSKMVRGFEGAENLTHLHDLRAMIERIEDAVIVYK